MGVGCAGKGGLRRSELEPILTRPRPRNYGAGHANGRSRGRSPPAPAHPERYFFFLTMFLYFPAFGLAVKPWVGASMSAAISIGLPLRLR